jgi:predicted transcriptional regulator
MPSRILQQPLRKQYEIIQHLLQTAYSKEEACTQFELAYESQLNWLRFIYYRDFLISRDLVISSDKGPAQHYEITPKGERFLQIFAEVEDDLRPVNANDLHS